MPPRLLTAEMAAAYLSIPVASAKRLTIGRTVLDGRVRWDRVAIDAHLDGAPAPGVLSPSPANSNDDEADAALAQYLADQAHVSRPS